ncbi:MAG TPA: CarD family transcriptional regulator, partial [Ferruginibacter sp.]|nr:CarD family transcriptional regulator [Ferruginibacter sp.]
TDFVYEPGQFAVRGGILDIYSFGNERPYRVELFGNEVDSIRIFDPESQLSERRLLQVTIIPNLNHREADQELLSDAEKISLFEFIPGNLLVWIHDESFVREKLAQQEEDVSLFLQLMAEGQFRKPEEEEEQAHTVVTENDFIGVADFNRLIGAYPLIEFHRKKSTADDPGKQRIAFDIQEQPSFNRQFELLIRNLKELESKQYNLFLFSDNAKQLERLHSIFSDLKAEINFTPILHSIHEGFVDHDQKLACYTDHQIFQRYHKYKVKQAFSKNKALTLKTLRELQPGDYVTHIDHGVGVYSGLQKIDVNGRLQEAVRIQYKDGDLLYVNISSLHKISKYSGKEGSIPKMNKLGSDVWNRLKEKTKKQVKDIAIDLIRLYAQRKSQQGFSFSPDNYMQTELEASFIY